MSTRRQPVACGVDIGSTNVKVALLAPDGEVLARRAIPTPRDERGLSIAPWTLMSAIESLIIDACGTRYSIAALSTAGIGEDGVLLDERLEVLTEALSWFDPRRQTVFRELAGVLGDDRTYDARADPARTMIGWRWSTQQLLVAPPRWWCAIADLPAAVWTGHVFLSDTLASRTGAWRTSARGWGQDRVEATLGDARLLPTVLPAGSVLGEVRDSTLRRSGVLLPDAVVVVGGHDHPVASWGIDQLSAGAILDAMGTAEVVVAQTARDDLPQSADLDLSAGIRSAGRTLMRVEELSRNITWASQNPEVGRRIREIVAGDLAPLPVLESGYFIPGVRGGGQPTYATSAPSDSRARASAVLGALALVGRDALSAVRHGAVAEGVVRSAGGWVRSEGWMSIKETVNGFSSRPVAEPEVTAVSAAMLAARGRGWNPDPVLALDGSVSGERVSSR